MHIKLPDETGKTTSYRLTGEPLPLTKPKTPFNRVAYAAAHVVADPLTASDPSGPPAIDWDRTLAFRTHLLDLGFGIAEAMDTSQRGMGLDWPRALDLIGHSLRHAGKRAGMIYSGCGTDQLAVSDAKSLDDVIRAYLDQLHAIQKVDGRIILMASRALVKVAKSPDDYVKVYTRVLQEADHPVILHWLGEMFDPALKGYWGSARFEPAMETALEAIAANVAKVDGIKISLLDDQKEIVMRRRLPTSVKMYTGDDFNYPGLIAGDDEGHSHALLGIFDAIAPAASAALAALAKGQDEEIRCAHGADGAAVAADLPGADAILQDGNRVPGLAQRASGPLHHGGWRSGDAPASLFHGDIQAGGPGGAAGRPGPRLQAHEADAGDLRRLEMRDLGAHPEICSINTATLGFQAPIAQVVDAVARAGFGGIAPWRREVEDHDVAAISRRIRDAGLKVSGYCRSTYIPASTREQFNANVAANRRAIDDAATLGSPCFVMVVGGLPAGSKDIADARAQVAEASALLLEHGKKGGCPDRTRAFTSGLCSGPLMPVAALRSARPVRCDRRRAADPWLGTLIDVYHLWWDPNLARDIARAGASRRIFGFHVCDWLVPTADVLNDRGMMGDGIIDVPAIRTLVEDAGYAGPVEVEIFSAANWWTRPMDETLQVCRARFASAT